MKRFANGIPHCQHRAGDGMGKLPEREQLSADDTAMDLSMRNPPRPTDGVTALRDEARRGEEIASMVAPLHRHAE